MKQIWNSIFSGKETDSSDNNHLLSKPPGRYTNLQLLGKGGMGVVYQAHDPALRRNVAIKFIHLKSQARDLEWRQRFEREAQAVGQLNHPHIVTIYDVNLESDPLYVVMELLTGGTLHTRLQGKRLSWQEVLALFYPLGQALAYAHQVGVIHRDLKPANVIFHTANTPGGDGILKLVDFGLAHWPAGEKITQPGMVMGTLSYMSPEQASGKEVDHRTDIFALGIMLFEAISGHNPLDKGNQVATLQAITSEQPIDLAPLRDKAPFKVIHLIERAIAKERDQRYFNCETLLIDLVRCMDAPPLSSTIPVINRLAPGPKIITANINLTQDEEAVLKAMFSVYSRIGIEAEFGRGLSGSRVLRVRPVEDNSNKIYLPAVVKLAPAGLIQQEWQAYQTQVEQTLWPIARLESVPILLSGNPVGGLRYTLVGGGISKVQSLADYYQQASAADLRWVLQEQLFKPLDKQWWRMGQPDVIFQMQIDYDRLLPVNLTITPSAGPPPTHQITLIEPGRLPSSALVPGDYVHLRGFIVTEVEPRQGQLTLNLPRRLPNLPSYRLRLKQTAEVDSYRVGDTVASLYGLVTQTRHQEIVDQANRVLNQMIETQEQLSLSNNLSLPNPLLSYPAMLYGLQGVKISTIHGDLNLENILVDPKTRTISLIDFATARQGHVMHDLLRLETGIVTRLLPKALKQVNLPPETIHRLYQLLHPALTTSKQITSAQLPHLALEKVWEMLLAIRQQARYYLFDSDEWQEYYRGLILYLLGALKFKDLDDMPEAPYPKQIAFWGAATLAGLVVEPPDEPTKTEKIVTSVSQSVEPERSSLSKDTVKSPEFPWKEPYYQGLSEREEQIARIISTLGDSEQRPMVVVTGLGGIGKTALAVEVVRRCTQTQRLPFQAITWDSAKQKLFIDGKIIKVRDAVITFSDLVDSLGRQLEGPDFVRIPLPKREATLREILRGSSCLIVVDNLETVPNAQEILTRLHELLGQSSRALITSRNEVVGDYFKISLRGLSEGNSVLFLKEEARQRNIQSIIEADEESLQAVGRVTGGMPLAMKLIISQAERLGLEAALDILQEGRGDIYFFIFLGSWRLLSDTAKKLLLYLGPTVNAVSRKELELALKVTEDTLDKAIEELVRLSLINPQSLPGLKQMGYTIHQLTRYFIVNDLPLYWKREGII